jgi:hypothetical protein
MLILGECPLEYVIKECMEHYLTEQAHQGIGTIVNKNFRHISTVCFMELRSCVSLMAMATRFHI